MECGAPAPLLQSIPSTHPNQQLTSSQQEPKCHPLPSAIPASVASPFPTAAVAACFSLHRTQVSVLLTHLRNRKPSPRKKSAALSLHRSPTTTSPPATS